MQAGFGDFVLDHGFSLKIKDVLRIFNSLNSLLNLCTVFCSEVTYVYIIRESVRMCVCVFVCLCVCVCVVDSVKYQWK